MWEKIISEVKAGRYAGPFNDPPYKNFIQSPLGLVPKANGKTRLIFHLSYDFEEKSVNHYIPSELCSVKYNDLDSAIEYTLALEEKPIFYGKTDFSNVYRFVPLSPGCCCWLLMRAQDPISNQWNFFVEKCLPFGSSISCAIFQRVSNAVKHCYLFMVTKNRLVIWVVNYLDDFLFIQLLKLLCDKAIELFLEMCQHLGITVALEKTEWGTTRIVFLGMLLDGEQLIIAIPEDKRCKAINMLEMMVSKRKATVKEMQRLEDT